MRLRGLPDALALLVVLVALVLARPEASNRTSSKPPVRPVTPIATGAPVPDQLEWLSHDVRRSRLSAAERTQISEDLGHGRSNDQIAAALIDRWFDDDTVLTHLVQRWLLMWQPNARHLFAEQLTRARDATGAWVYFLNSKRPVGSSIACETTPVDAVAWWAPDRVIRICPSSYLPDKPFDDVGWCGGQLEPRLPEPARTGCGCGALLMACLPPEDEVPGITHRINDDLTAEVVNTTVAFIRRDGSYLDWLTASDTWQTELVRFLYLRRELVGRLHAEGYSEQLEHDMRARLSPTPLAPNGKLTPRPPPYAGTGLLLNTPYEHSLISTYRDLRFQWSLRIACQDQNWSVHVDRDAVLKAMAAAHGSSGPIDVRFDVWDSPMRKMDGCRTCHLPMDSPAAYLGQVQVPLQGSYTRQLERTGEFYLANYHDLRGTATSQESFVQLALRQPEVSKCAIKRAVQAFAGSNPDNPALDDEITALDTGFRANGYRIRTMLKRFLSSRVYAMSAGASSLPAETDRAASELFAKIKNITDGTCAKCHDKNHRSLDLTSLPPRASKDEWWKILEAIESERMPPDKRGSIRYPLEPGVRAELVRAVRGYLSVDATAGPRTVSAELWIDKLDQLLGATVPPAERRGRMERYQRLTSRSEGPIRAVLVEAMSSEVCETLVEARRLDRDHAETSVVQLYAEILDMPPPDDELRRAAGELDRVGPTPAAHKEALVALCTGYLTGPKTWSAQ